MLYNRKVAHRVIRTGRFYLLALLNIMMMAYRFNAPFCPLDQVRAEKKQELSAP